MLRKRATDLAGLMIILVATSRPVLSTEVRTLDARTLSEAFVAAVEKVAPAVVSINGERQVNPEELGKIEPLFQFLPKKYQESLRQHPPLQKWQGSGIIIRPDGLVLTNNHVLEDAEMLSIGFPDGRRFVGEVVGRDPYTDVALVRMTDSPGDLPTAVLGDSDNARIAEWVLAIGSPFGLSGSVSEGIISAKHRTNEDVPIGRGSLFLYKDFLQTTAAINVGNSGGPLINLDGEVIGINNSIQTAGIHANLGIGFAIPSNMARFVVESLLEHGRVVRGWLGVGMGKADPYDWGTPPGALVINVYRNTPAEKAGVERGDVIVSFNQTEVRSDWELMNLVTQTAVGTSAVLTVVRDKQHLTLPVIIEEYPSYLLPGSQEQEKSLMGFVVEELTEQNRDTYGYPRQSRGMVIIKVRPGGNAEKAGLQSGDLILEIEDPTPDFETYRAKISDLLERVAEKKEMTILLRVDRLDESGDFPRYFSLRIRAIDVLPQRK